MTSRPGISTASTVAKAAESRSTPSATGPVNVLSSTAPVPMTTRNPMTTANDAVTSGQPSRSAGVGSMALLTVNIR
jgi:hypothetical protein